MYVHVPFCAKRCDYCAFATWTDRAHLMDPYVGACVAEIGASKGSWPRAATTVFFGGGTPSLLPAPMMTRLIQAIPVSTEAEITVECNPETVDEALLTTYRGAGVTRLSFGVQSMVPHVLDSLGRLHDAGSVRRAVECAALAGFGHSYNVDLIYGAAGESLEDWRDTVKAVLSLDPPPAHVSAYGLTVEPGTPLAADSARHPDDDDQADKYLMADGLLGDAGYEWYEISNWARPGARCRHNLLYWSQGEYSGVGCAAHSHRAIGAGRSRRWWNVRTPDRYIAQIVRGEPPVAAGEVLEGRERELEALQLALRTREGVPSGCLPEDPSICGLVARNGGTAVLSLRGRLLANEVALRLEPSLLNAS